jgi:hypothetical protein
MQLRIFLFVSSLFLASSGVSGAVPALETGVWQSMARAPYSPTSTGSYQMRLEIKGTTFTVTYSFFDSSNSDPVMDLKMTGSFAVQPRPASDKILDLEIKSSIYTLAIKRASPLLSDFQVEKCAKVGQDVNLQKVICGKFPAHLPAYRLTLVQLPENEMLLSMINDANATRASETVSLIPLKKQ